MRGPLKSSDSRSKPDHAQSRNQRVGLFIDVQNLYHSAKNLYQGRVNYRELVKQLTGERQLVRAMAYVVKSEGITDSTGKLLSATERERLERAAHQTPGKEKTAEKSSEAAFFDALEDAGL